MQTLRTLLLAALFASSSWSQSLPQSETSKILMPETPGTWHPYFGGSVAISGQTGVIGARGNDASGMSNNGSAWKFDVLTGNMLQPLIPNNPGSGFLFGHSVAMSSTRTIVGSPDYNGAASDSGTAYVFKTSTGQQQIQLIPTAGGASGDNLGSSVAISNTHAVAGAPHRDHPTSLWNAGSVYVFDLSLGSQLHELMAPAPQAYAYFGHSVAISGSLVLVGAPEQDAGFNQAGVAYLFNANTGSLVHTLKASDRSPGDRFGSGVAIDGNYAVIGAPGDDDMGSYSGSVYVFDVNTGLEVTKFTSDWGAAYVSLGESVSVSGDLVVAGVQFAEGVTPDVGMAHMFSIETGEELLLYSSDGEEDDEFGCGVAIDQEQVLVGAWHADPLGSYTGAAYSFEVSGDILNTGTAFCFGDGSGATCPCAASGDAGAGCMNSTGATGAKLAGAGDAAISHVSFFLTITGAPANKPGLVLQGSMQLAGGQGNAVGDGLLCAAGQTSRSQVQLTNGAGSAEFTGFQDQTFGAASFGAGSPTVYQFWYRDPLNGCSGSGFNFSNAWTMTWQP